MFDLIPWKRKKTENEGEMVAQGDTRSLARLHEELDNLFDRFWHEWPEIDVPWKGWPAGSELANQRWGCDVDDRENEIVVRAEAPGFEPDEFDVRVTSGHLVLEAEHKEESKEGDSRRYQYGKFQRAFPLPAGAEEDKVEARYHNGVLEVKIPKGEQAKAKRITVQAS